MIETAFENSMKHLERQLNECTISENEFTEFLAKEKRKFRPYDTIQYYDIRSLIIDLVDKLKEGFEYIDSVDSVSPNAPSMFSVKLHRPKHVLDMEAISFEENFRQKYVQSVEARKSELLQQIRFLQESK